MLGAGQNLIFQPRFPVRAQDERERVFEAVLRQF
jgi:hypothetical protein